MSNKNSELGSPLRVQTPAVNEGHSKLASNASKTSISSESRGVPPVRPPTKIIGVLNELQDDIVTSPQPCNISLTGSNRGISCSGPTSGVKDIYIEQNGKFIKSSKDHDSEFCTKTVYLEEVGSSGFVTPLDMAILIEKGCTTISRILLGLLAGVALLKLLLVCLIYTSQDAQGLLTLGSFYAVLVDISSTLFLIMFPICLVSIFDWFDLAHADFQHFIDTLVRRKIFIILLIYLVGFILFLLTAPYNDFIMFSWTDKLSFSELELVTNMETWKNVTTAFCALCIVGWVIVAITRNEDLFYIHLVGMKKYEDEEAHLAFENRLACHQMY